MTSEPPSTPFASSPRPSGSPASGRRRPPALALALALAALILAPVAVADHAYSHRYLIYGRVVDAEGNGVPGVTVDVQTRQFYPNDDGCASRPGSRTDAFGQTETRVETNEFGEFIYCYHEHSMSRSEPGSAMVYIPSEGYFTNISLDPYFRENFVPIVLPHASPNATRAIDDNYTVLGRIWRPYPNGVILEGNSVFGLTLVDSPVNVTLRLDDGTVLNRTTWSNDYGDYAVRFPLAHRASGGTVTIQTSGNLTVNDTKPVDPKLGITVFETTAPSAGLAPWRSIAIAAGVVVGVVAVGTGGVVGAIRLRSRRDEQAARSRSSRRRAKR